jgi:hypothetical protein
MNDQDRLTYLPRHYYDLQTLRFAPLWIGQLAWLAYNMRPGHWVAQGPAGRVLPSLALLTATALWYWLTMRYYRWRLGRLEVKQTILTMGFSWFWIFMALDQSAQSPWGETPWAWRQTPWFAGPIIAILLFLPVIDFRDRLARRIRYAVASAVIAATTVFSALRGWDAKPFIVTVCLTALALGLADHLLLMSLRTPAREDADA